MFLSKKAAALAAGFVAALSLVTLAQDAPPPLGGTEVLPVEEATVDWIEKSEVSALREGVIDRMELQIGMLARKGKPIGYLHSEIADLTVKKAQVAVSSKATEFKAIAQMELAMAVVATNLRLNQRKPGMVSQEEMRKAEAEVKVASAMRDEAIEKRALDKAELVLAERALVEHTIVAPFDGYILERYKNPGESVRANEPVARLGNLDKLRAWAYVPLEYAYRVKEGQVVEIQPKLLGTQGAPLAIEQKKFRGKITFVDPQIQAVAESAVRIYAEFDNKEHELRPGLKASMTIYLTSDPGAGTAVGSRTEPRRLER